MKSSFILKFAVHCFLGAALVACSSSSDTGTTTDAGKDGAIGTDTAGGGTDTAGGGTDTASGTDAPKTDAPKTDSGGGGDDACGTETTQQKCQTCCATNHTDGYNAFASALLGCACKDGVCKTECATEACADPKVTATATCNACLAKVQGASGACKADLDSCKTAACAPFFDCVAAQCAGKT